MLTCTVPRPAAWSAPGVGRGAAVRWARWPRFEPRVLAVLLGEVELERQLHCLAAQPLVAQSDSEPHALLTMQRLEGLAPQIARGRLKVDVRESRVSEPVVVGQDVVVERGALLERGIVLGRGVFLERGALVQSRVFLERSVPGGVAVFSHE